MWRLHASPRSRNWPRFNGDDSEPALFIGGNASISLECRFDRLGLRVFGVRIFAVSVGLPNLENRIGNGNSVAIQYAALDCNPFSRNAWAGQVCATEASEAGSPRWTDGFRGGGG